MCTLTVVSRDPGQPRLMFNRDESVERPEALPPRIHRVGDREVIFPIDPPSGGTWIAASDSGHILALLNRNPTPPDEPGERPSWAGRRSRGVIIPSLVAAITESDVAAGVGAIRPNEYPPFELVFLTSTRLRSWESDGWSLREVRSGPADELWLITSSGLGDDVVDVPRRALFEETFVGPPADWHRRQETFHRHRWKAAPGISVAMLRPEARTVSTTTVELFPDRVRMTYRSSTATKPFQGLVVGRAGDGDAGSPTPCASVAVPVRS